MGLGLGMGLGLVAGLALEVGLELKLDLGLGLGMGLVVCSADPQTRPMGCPLAVRGLTPRQAPFAIVG